MSKTYRKRKFCILITIDVKNAFNSAPWVKIIEAMEEMKISPYLIKIIQNYLSERKIVGEEFDKNMTAGVPQGSVLGPTLWNILYNGLLKLLVPEDTTLVAYADDLAVIVKAINEILLENRANQILKKIKEWMEQKGLTIAPEKSEVIPLMGKKKFRPLQINLDGKTLEVKNNLK